MRSNFAQRGIEFEDGTFETVWNIETEVQIRYSGKSTVRLLSRTDAVHRKLDDCPCSILFGISDLNWSWVSAA
jgi:hypothetical protein